MTPDAARAGLLLQAPLDRLYLDHWAAPLDLDELLQEANNGPLQP